MLQKYPNTGFVRKFRCIHHKGNQYRPYCRIAGTIIRLKKFLFEPTKKLLNKPSELREKFQENWDGHCKSKITSTKDIELSGELLSYVDGFDFTIFSSKSHIELIDAHSHTRFHSVRFGGGLPLRPLPEEPPMVPTGGESHIIHILNA